jgi:alpha-1,3-glucanase-like protein
MGSAVASASAAAQPAPTPQTMAALPIAELGGRGARVPFVEHEAENAATNGSPIGPSRTFTTLAAEASGRRAVRLDRPGDYVEFVLAAPANAVTVRYAVPDSADGKGLDATLGVYVGRERLASLAMTSRYGWYYGRYPFTNRPADGLPHHFYDEAPVMLGRTLPAGAVVRLMVGEDDAAAWYAIDLADFELVPPPLAPPSGSLSVVDFGANPTGVRDASSAIARAVRAGQAQRRPVWLPPGTFKLTRHIRVDQVEIAGAGPWHSVLRGAGAGIYGRTDGVQSRGVTLRDFAIIGEVTERIDRTQLSGVGGAMGAGSRISNLWIQHHKVGLWFDGPMDGITITGLRIVDNTADGLNFRGGVSKAVVENTFVRNSGDDGLAMWSHRRANHDNAFRSNTVIAPILANGVAIYGGRDIEVRGNLVADTVTQGGGLHVGNRFSAVPVAGTITLADNLVARGGVLDPNWRFGVGALWFYALDAPMTADIVVSDNDLVDSSYEAVQLLGKAITGVRVEDLRIRGAGTFAIQLQAPGEASFTRVTATGLGAAGVHDCGSGFVMRQGAGNSGWDSRACGYPEPKRGLVR